MVLEHLGVSSVGHVALYDALCCVLRSLVRTTATVGKKLKTGRITALGSGSYSYCFWNDGCTGGFYCGGSCCKELYGCSYWNWLCLADRSWSTLDDKWIGVGAMNKKTRAIDEETYKLIIATMKNGFAHEGVQYKPNERIATVLVLEYNLGLRVGDILNLTVDSFVKDGSRYRLDIYEQKTGKYRNFTVVNEIYQFVRDYAYAHNISSKAKLFPITERAVLKHLKSVCAYLGVEGVASHSFRKGFATNVYVNNHYNIELVRILLNHASVTTSQRYIGIGSKELEDAIQKNICLG